MLASTEPGVLLFTYAIHGAHVDPQKQGCAPMGSSGAAVLASVLCTADAADIYMLQRPWCGCASGSVQPEIPLMWQQSVEGGLKGVALVCVRVLLYCHHGVPWPCTLAGAPGWGLQRAGGDILGGARHWEQV